MLDHYQQFGKDHLVDETEVVPVVVVVVLVVPMVLVIPVVPVVLVIPVLVLVFADTPALVASVTSTVLLLAAFVIIPSIASTTVVFTAGTELFATTVGS